LGLREKRIVLASASPRRASLFELAGFRFEVQPSEINERDEVYTIPEVQVLELSQKKAWKVAETTKDGLVIGADTIVVLDGRTLGKPENADNARAMLRDLSGRTHIVFTGFTIIEQPAGEIVSDYERTEVTFRALSDSEIDAYVETGSPLDKAGAYGIQDHGALFVSKVSGCFYNVMGFPLSRFYVRLREMMKKQSSGNGAKE